MTGGRLLRWLPASMTIVCQHPTDLGPGDGSWVYTYPGGGVSGMAEAGSSGEPG
jgi:hypothetical protein